jgi:dihydroxyacetone kinase-like predicted kinase
MGGWILNNLKDSMHAMKETEDLLMDKVQRIEVLVAGSYVKKEDMEKMSETILNKLDSIEQRLTEYRLSNKY